MYQRKSTSGDTKIDRMFDDFIDYVNRMGLTSGTTASMTQYPITPEGGHYWTGINGMGYKLQKGILVKASLSDDNKFIICNEDDYNVSGVIYEDTPAGGTCKVVYSGPAYVYFNSNGVSRGDFWRMSKAADTVNDDTGKAQGKSEKPDSLWLKGFAHYSLIGEGLALCSVLR